MTKTAGTFAKTFAMRTAEEHAAARWALAQKHGRLRGHIKLTIADLDDLIADSRGTQRLMFNIIRTQHVNALREDEEAT